MVKLVHPNTPNVTSTVSDDAVDGWLAQGWRRADPEPDRIVTGQFGKPPMSLDEADKFLGRTAPQE